ncbi:MAG TPA: hypothetical protein PLN63_04380 [Paludibacteraceae bacterium]|nr:hypothetical protein [Paludibacteraceae bacterium]
MNIKRNSILLLTLFSLFSCKEEMEIDIEEGDRMIGIYGSITDEEIKHQVIISKSADFYKPGNPDMVQNAEVFVLDNWSDTIKYQEIAPGVYETIDTVKGEVGHTYTLSVIFNDNGETKQYYAQETLLQPPGNIDTIVVCPLSFNGHEIDNIYKVCPYFQSLKGDDVHYLSKVALDGRIVTDSLSEYSVYNFEGLSGMYINGKEMEELYDGNVFPEWVCILDTSKSDEKLFHDQLLTLYIYRISEEYANFVQDVQNSSGNDPMFGSPANVRSNIKPEGKALGYFYTASIVKGDVRLK